MNARPIHVHVVSVSPVAALEVQYHDDPNAVAFVENLLEKSRMKVARIGDASQRPQMTARLIIWKDDENADPTHRALSEALATEDVRLTWHSSIKTSLV